MKNRPDREDALGQWVREAGDPIVSPHPRYAETLRATILDRAAAAAQAKPVPASRWLRITHVLVGLNMKQRIAAFGGVGVAALLAFLLLWGAVNSKPVSAMEKMAESIRKAKSFKAAVIWEGKRASEPGKPLVTDYKVVGTLYWLAPGSSRFDIRANIASENLGEQEITEIQFAGRGVKIVLDHKAKTLTKIWLPTKRAVFGAEILEELGKFSGQADRDLGIKDIHGKKARGFQIDMKKIIAPPDDEADQAKDVAEIWIDRESALPVLVEINWNSNLKRAGAGTGCVRLQDFQWNIDLDPKLFDTAVPAGYAEKTFHEPSVEGRVRWFTTSLRAYTELTGGHDYPQAITVRDCNTVHKSLLKACGFAWPANPNAPELKHNNTFQKIESAYGGLTSIVSLVNFLNTDAAYHGKTVKPGERDKVLLRWKLDDGRYEAIFGDLHAETLTAERLRALEGNHNVK